MQIRRPSALMLAVCCRSTLTGDIADQPLHLPVAAPKSIGRLYFLFQKPIRTQGDLWASLCLHLFLSQFKTGLFFWRILSSWLLLSCVLWMWDVSFPDLLNLCWQHDTAKVMADASRAQFEHRVCLDVHSCCRSRRWDEWSEKGAWCLSACEERGGRCTFLSPGMITVWITNINGCMISSLSLFVWIKERCSRENFWGYCELELVGIDVVQSSGEAWGRPL